MKLELELELKEAETFVGIVGELLDSAQHLAPPEEYYVLFKSMHQLDKQMHEKFPNWCTAPECHMESNEKKLIKLKEELDLKNMSKLPMA